MKSRDKWIQDKALLVQLVDHRGRRPLTVMSLSGVGSGELEPDVNSTARLRC